MININLILYITILVLYLCSKAISEDEKKRNTFFLNSSFIAMFIVLFLRKPYSDLITYIEDFYLFDGKFENLFLIPFEIGYNLLNIIVGKIWLNERFFIFVIDILGLIGPYYLIKNKSKNYLYSIIIYITFGTFYMNFLVIRQVIAISILAFSIKYIEEKNFLKFMALVILAATFHKSALIFTVLYFYDYIKLDNKKLNIIMILFVLLFLIKNQLTNIIMMNFGYSEYIGKSFNVSNEGYEFLLMFFAIYIYCILNRTKIFEDKFNVFLISSFIIAVMFQILTTASSVFSRVTYYFTFSFMLLPINILEKSESRITERCIKILIMIFLSLFVLVFNHIEGYELMWAKVL